MVPSKMFDRANTMFTTMINKHAEDLRTADYDWYVIETFDPRYPDQLIQSIVPWVRLDFK